MRKSNLKKAMEKGLARKYENNKLRKRKKILERFLKTEKGQEVLEQIESGALPADSLDVDGKNIEIKATVVPEEADAAVAEVVEEEPDGIHDADGDNIEVTATGILEEVDDAEAEVVEEEPEPEPEPEVVVKEDLEEEFSKLRTGGEGSWNYDEEEGKENE